MTLISSDSASSDHQKPLSLSSHSIDKQFLTYHLDNIFNKV
jgi:hypothetical protein